MHILVFLHDDTNRMNTNPNYVNNVTNSVTNFATAISHLMMTGFDTFVCHGLPQLFGKLFGRFRQNHNTSKGNISEVCLVHPLQESARHQKLVDGDVINNSEPRF